tara:strand:+ start:57 stop:302 length:246 start_codon:yes stop_codon:yes gene_type:complete
MYYPWNLPEGNDDQLDDIEQYERAQLRRTKAQAALFDVAENVKLSLYAWRNGDPAPYANDFYAEVALIKAIEEVTKATNSQ